MLRIWRCDCALCVIGNSFPCRKPHNPTATLLRGLTHTTPRTKTPRRFTAKKPNQDVENYNLNGRDVMRILGR